MIYVWEMNSDVGEYEKIGQLTDEREFIKGEDRLCRIFPKEYWETADVELILARLNNGHVMASYEPTEPNSLDTHTCRDESQ